MDREPGDWDVAYLCWSWLMSEVTINNKKIEVNSMVRMWAETER